MTPVMAKMVNPATYTGLRPTRSASLPIGSSVMLIASTYPMGTHWVVGRSLSKWLAMDGSAMIMLPWSATTVNSPKRIAEKARYRLRWMRTWLMESAPLYSPALTRSVAAAVDRLNHPH